ncbi:sulfurtransferase TusA family protein [Telmatospirillum sp. J64-1]|uniref:sulfurtransferase TusA family protein n=1 Tax=Telmatospirillum sp. J64-1 TaxID=2502183 RepID=UPI00115F211C|nr:sulfurtransferase TusA family protein [Telmatospirillum sp. J64-1]
MTENANYYLDITNEICPMTFVKTKLLIEKMAKGEVAEIRLKGEEPLKNVPRSVAELGHHIRNLSPEEGEGSTGVHRLFICKA